MQLTNHQGIQKNSIDIESVLLQRTVRVDCFLPLSADDLNNAALLLINDGQNMDELGLSTILENLNEKKEISPLLCVAIHAGERLMEYGTADVPDYLGRGYKARLYGRFVMEELIPLIKSTYKISYFKQKAFAGFSLGGLSALDIVWSHPGEFKIAGIFSGSLWWRAKGLDDGYNEDIDRIMHSIIRNGTYAPGLKFFFQTGALDETMDRNHNGIIDSIDDTLGLINELLQKGYEIPKDILYLEMQEGRHDIATWAKAMPEFLKWAFPG